MMCCNVMQCFELLLLTMIHSAEDDGMMVGTDTGVNKSCTETYHRGERSAASDHPLNNAEPTNQRRSRRRRKEGRKQQISISDVLNFYWWFRCLFQKKSQLKCVPTNRFFISSPTLQEMKLQKSAIFLQVLYTYRTTTVVSVTVTVL